MTSTMKKLALFTAAGLMLPAAAAMAQVVNQEQEPNDTKAQANPFTMAAGDSITGATTGTSTSVAGGASADYFRVRTVAAPLGIYRYRLVAQNTTAYAYTIRGLSQTGTSTAGGTIGVGDNTAQTASATSTPPRFVQWYGFGRQEEVYYRVTGTTSTTSGYNAVLVRDPVTPVVFGGTIVAGNVTIANVAANTNDLDIWVYDSNFNPVPGAGRDDGPFPFGPLTVNLPAGTYFLALTNFNLANNQPGPVGETSFGTVLDFPNAVLNSSTTTLTNMNMQFTSSAGTVPTTGLAKTDPFQIIWLQFTVQPPTVPTPPTGTGTATPSTVLNDGTGTTVLAVTVTPGQNPTSSGIGVTVNGSSIGAGTITLLDNGVAPDAVAGDNIFTASATVANGTAVGATTLPFSITDAQSRTGTGNINLNITQPPPRNDDCANAIAANLGDTPFNSLNATTSTPAFQCGSGGTDIWYSFTAPSDGGYIFETCNSPVSFDSVVEVRDACGGAVLGCNDDGPTGCGTAVTVRLSRVQVNGLTRGQTVLVRVGTFAAGAGAPGVLTIRTAPPTNPTAFGSTIPAPLVAGTPGLIRVNVTPGQNPTSTGITVTADLSSIGGSATQALFDDGTNGDAVAGDNIFNFNYNVPLATAAGAYTIPFSVADAQTRTASGTISTNVRQQSGACCLPAGCQILSLADCTTQGGNFLGDGSTCITPANFNFTQDATAVYEDISADPGAVSLTLTDDSSVGPLPMGFSFSFYGTSYTDFFVGSNGYVTFGAGFSLLGNVALPTATGPRPGIFGLWDDLNPGIAGSQVQYITRGTAGVDLRTIVQFTNVPKFGTLSTDPKNNFQMVMFENGNVAVRYQGLFNYTIAGDYTVGTQNAAGTVGRNVNAVANASYSGVFNPVDVPNCPPQCRADYNQDTVLNTDDISDYITDYFTSPEVSGPGGYAAPCPGAPAPYDTLGYKADFNSDCVINTDDISDFITAYFQGC